MDRVDGGQIGKGAQSEKGLKASIQGGDKRAGGLKVAVDGTIIVCFNDTVSSSPAKIQFICGTD